MIEKHKMTLMGDGIGTTPCSKVLVLAANPDVITTSFATLFSLAAESLLNPAVSASSLLYQALPLIFMGALFRATTYHGLDSEGLVYTSRRNLVINMNPEQLTPFDAIMTQFAAAACLRTAWKGTKVAGTGWVLASLCAASVNNPSLFVFATTATAIGLVHNLYGFYRGSKLATGDWAINTLLEPAKPSWIEARLQKLRTLFTRRQPKV